MPDETPTPMMPCLETGFWGFHHTVDSALKVLSDLGLSASRVTLRMEGRGHPSRWVVFQEPKPGTRLTGDVRVELSISGLGYFHDLPVGMWDVGGEEEPGTREILEPIDDPLQKAAHWIREGAMLFDIGPSNFEACSRWISLFGLRPGEWPLESWYPLSLLLPHMQDIADTAEGIRLAFQLLLHLQISEVRFLPSTRSFPKEEWSLLGERSCRLGIDAVLGNRLEDLAGIWIVAGPISLSVYKKFQEDENKQLITNVLALSVNCRRMCRVTWLVEDRERPPRLGYESQNGRLAINSHLGRLVAAEG
jgi:Type VI secretion, TssG